MNRAQQQSNKTSGLFEKMISAGAPRKNHLRNFAAVLNSWIIGTVFSISPLLRSHHFCLFFKAVNYVTFLTVYARTLQMCDMNKTHLTMHKCLKIRIFETKSVRCGHEIRKKSIFRFNWQN